MYSRSYVKDILDKVSRRILSARAAYKELADLPYKDLGFAKIDNHRSLRRGFPEVIFCRGKSRDQVAKILNNIWGSDGSILMTHATKALYNQLKKDFKDLRFSKPAGMIYLKRTSPHRKKGKVLIVTGGTADLPIAEQARVTLELMGDRSQGLYDVGVAGIHRLFDKLKILKQARVVIVIAGMEGALASVVSGLVQAPVIAVPTSVGYGASFKGISALLTMLNSCSPGIGVVNIDNGFGAGYLASLINR